MAPASTGTGSGDKVARMTHELMTALAVAKGNTQVLRRRAGRPGTIGEPGQDGGFGTLDPAQLAGGLDQIDAALNAAAAASYAMIAHIRASGAVALPAPERLDRRDGPDGPDRPPGDDRTVRDG